MISEVTQEDRDAALPFIATDFRPGDTYSTGYYVRRGERDDHPLVQAFARHRLTAQSGEGRSGAGEDAIENAEKWLRAISDWLLEHDYDMVLPSGPLDADPLDLADALAALNARQSGEGEREALREALAEAYRKGATDVHSYWVNNPGEPPRGDPEFGESASDYAAAALDTFDSAAALRATDDAGGA